MNPLIDDSGRALHLDQQLASGGEGSVFLVRGDPAVVAKVYHQPPSPHQVEKLTALLRSRTPALAAVCAWPHGLLRDARTRQVIGFTMPRLTDGQPLQHLYATLMRRRHFPRKGWKFQVAAARNLAAAFDDVHRAGCLVGDVNQSNAFVNGTALVRLIDCDSFQVRADGRAYPCEVGTPHYTPPELQGRSLRGLVRTENHDRFGLAVLVYQLLFVGWHPYSGVYRGRGEPSFEELIAQFRFAQGPMAATWDMDPPPHTPNFADIPADIGGMFRRAFERGSENGPRPTATEWVAALDHLAGSVATCRADAGHEYWSGAAGCVWCRLAQSGGPEYYGGTAAFAVDEAKLHDVLRRLASVRVVEFPPPPELPPTPREPRPMPAELQPLLAAVRAAREDAERQLADRLQAEATELRAIDEDERQRLAVHQKKYKRQELELEDEWDELDEAEQEAANLARERKFYFALLLTTTVLGGVGLLVGLLTGSEAGSLIGAMCFLVFGLWFVSYLIYQRVYAEGGGSEPIHVRTEELRQTIRSRLSESASASASTSNIRRDAAAAREAVIREVRRGLFREVDRTSEILDHAVRPHLQRARDIAADAKSRIMQLINEWRKLVDEHRERHKQKAQMLRDQAELCRALGREYTTERQQFLAASESQGRDRHLRMHLIADAGLPLIGSEIRTLVSQGILSAADVSRAGIGRLAGFGDVLVETLMAWRDEVIRRFSHNPVPGIPNAGELTLNERYRERQRQLITEMDGLLDSLESDCHLDSTHLALATLETLFRQLQQAALDRDQGDADYKQMAHLLPS